MILNFKARKKPRGETSSFIFCCLKSQKKPTKVINEKK